MQFENHRCRVHKLRQVWEGAGELNAQHNEEIGHFNFLLAGGKNRSLSLRTVGRGEVSAEQGGAQSPGRRRGSGEKRVGENFQEVEMTKERLRMVMCGSLL